MELGIKQHVEDIYKCTRCGYCREMVRAKDTTFRICPIHESTAGFEVFTGKGKMLLMRGVLEGILEMNPRLAEIFFTCTTCGSCKAHCPVGIDTVGIFEIFRNDLMARELSPAAHTMFGKYTIEKKNPYNEPHDQRIAWIPEDFEFSKPAEIAYFVGCTSSYRQKELAIATFKILKKLGVDFTILGSEEWCCGSTLFRTGQLKQATELAQHNIEKLNGLGVKQILFSCAGCFRTFASDYSKVGKLKAKPVTFAKFIHEKIKDGSLTLKDLPVKVTYHDPCHTTRSLKKADYNTPRRVLQVIPSIELVEMESTQEGSMCCGAGGGVKSAFPEIAVSAAQNRVQQALPLNVKYLISTCPFCKRNLSDAQKANNYPIEVIDLVELVADRLE